MFKNKKTLLAVLFPLQILLIKFLANYPDFIENYYSNGLYPIISKEHDGWYIIWKILSIRFIIRNARYSILLNKIFS